MEPEPPFEVIAAFDYAKEGNHEVGFSAGDLIRCLRQDGDWWYGNCHSQTGWFPATYMDKTSIRRAAISAPVDVDSPNAGGVPGSEEQMPENPAGNGDEGNIEIFAELKCFVGIFSYIAQNQDELSFSASELIMVSKKSCDGWFYGSLKADSGGGDPASGWLPSNYVRAVPVDTPATPMGPTRTNSAKLLKAISSAYTMGPTPKKPSLFSKMNIFSKKTKREKGSATNVNTTVADGRLGIKTAEKPEPVNLASTEMRTSMRDLISRLQKAVSETANEQAQLHDGPVVSTAATPAAQTRAESPPVKPRSPRSHRSPRNMSPATQGIQGSPGGGESPTPRRRSSNQIRTVVSASTIVTSDSISTVDFSDGGGSASEPCAPSAGDQNNLSNPHTQVIAIYDCHADAEDELSFAKGDLLNLVTDSTDGDWWRGFIEGSPETEGLIPKNHARALFPEELKLISKQNLVLDYAYETSLSSRTSSQAAPESPRLRPEKVAPAPPSRGNSSAQLQPVPRPTAPRRTTSIKYGRKKIVRRPIPTPAQGVDTAVTSIENTLPAPRSSKRRLAPRPATVSENFESNGEGQMTLRTGQTIFVTQRDDPVWWCGENPSSGESGSFPASSVALLNSRQPSKPRAPATSPRVRVLPLIGNEENYRPPASES
jgi:hypothetical protein